MERTRPNKFRIDAEDILDGEVQIFRRTDSTRWYATFRNAKQSGKKGNLTQSLRTKNKEEAISFAREKYFKYAEKKRLGMKIIDYTVKQACDRFLEVYRETRGVSAIQRAERSVDIFNQFFDEKKELSDVKQFEITDFHKFWKNYAQKQALENGRKITNWEDRWADIAVHLRGIFKQAVDDGYIRKADIPNIKAKKKLSRRKARFTNEEVELISNKLLEYSKNPYSSHGRKISWKVFYYRLFSYYLFNSLRYSGCRPKELLSITWNDVYYRNKDNTDEIPHHDMWEILLDGGEGKNVRTVEFLDYDTLETRKITYRYKDRIPFIRFPDFMTKTKKERNAYCHREMTALLCDWDILTAQYGFKYVFPNHLGKPIRGGRGIGQLKPFDEAVEELGIRENSRGERRTLYSVRHYFATEGIHKQLPPYQLAQSMGTSLEMFEKTYVDALDTRNADFFKLLG